MITNETITKLVEQHVQGTDVFLVEVDVKPGNAIRIHVDRPEGISIDECVKISRFLNEQLDRDVEDYSLEVSSPGLGAPFRVMQQYEKNLGRQIEVYMTDGNRLEGKLGSVSEESIVLAVKGNERVIRMDEIKKAKAIVTIN
jgi:ribosome maturation factor RimP